MRGDASTKHGFTMSEANRQLLAGCQSRHFSRSFSTLWALVCPLLRPLICPLLLAMAIGCDPPPGSDDDNSTSDPGGHVAMSWTLNGVTLNAQGCTAAGISSMSVLVISALDANQNVEYEEVACGLDKYSVTMTPLGKVRIFVDGMKNLSGSRMCAHYAGQADTTASTQFPSQPVQVVLRATSECP